VIRPHIPNIDARGRRRRLTAGVATLAGGIALTSAFVVVGVRWPWALAVWPVFWLAALGVLQAREGT
jgi:hypothetical protein